MAVIDKQLMKLQSQLLTSKFDMVMNLNVTVAWRWLSVNLKHVAM